MIPLAGLPIIVSDTLFELRQFRFPRSKRARIRRKWAKRPHNHRPTDTSRCVRMRSLVGTETLVVTPRALETLKRQIAHPLGTLKP